MHFLTQDDIVGLKKILKVTITPSIVGNLTIHNSLAVIAIKVCLVHEISLIDFKSTKRHHNLIQARVDFYYIARKFTKKNDSDIARYLNRHHTITLHYARKHKPSANYKKIYGLLDQ